MNENASPRSNTELFAAVFCPSCRLSFAADAKVCPECGQPCDHEVVHDGQTQIIAQPPYSALLQHGSGRCHQCGVSRILKKTGSFHSATESMSQMRELVLGRGIGGMVLQGHRNFSELSLF